MLNRILSWARPAFAIAALFSCSYTQAQTIYYVSTAGDDFNTGTSWASPYRNLTKALAQANISSAAEVQIWVAAGSYTPVDGIVSLPADSRDTSFTFYRGTGEGKALKVYGGFAGTETAISQRDTFHRSYLDGDLGGGNSYHVGVIAGQIDGGDSIVVDGFTVRNGGASGLTTKVFNGVGVNRFSGGGFNISGNTNSNKICIRDCRFEYNTAANIAAGAFGSSVGQGAGMYISSSVCNIERCRFLRNTITGLGSSAGGGLYAISSTVRISGTDFLRNHVFGDYGTSTITGGTISGGGMVAQGCTITVTNSSFFQNATLGGYTYVYPSVYSCGSATGAGVSLSSSTCSFSSTNFTGNKAVGATSYTYGEMSGSARGAGIDAEFGRLLIDNCSFTADTAYAGLSADGSYYVGNANAGAIYSYNSGTDSLIALSSVFTNNAAIGGAVYNTRGGAIFANTNSLFRNTQFTNNVSAMMAGVGVAEGGAIFSGERRSVIVGCTFTGNRASGTGTSIGGAISGLRTNQLIDSSTFTGNSSTYGGAIGIYDNSLKLTNNVFTGNNASTGGCIYFAIYSLTSLTYTPHNMVANNVFNGNMADSAGGVAYLDMGVSGVDTMIGNIFSSNSANGHIDGGGAVNIVSSSHFLVNNTFFKDSSLANGGAVKIAGTGGIDKMANNIFYANVGSGSTQDTCVRSVGGFYVNTANHYGSTDPLFTNPANPAGTDGVWRTADDGLHLQLCSPAINTGNNTFIASLLSFDITNGARISGSAVDKGAYENMLTQPVMGADSMCIGSSLTFTDASSGGSWYSSNPAVATISPTGVVTALSLGVTRIRYVVSYGCITDTANRIVTVQGAPPAITSSSDHLCVYHSMVLSDAAPGGTWSTASSTIATVYPDGGVWGMASGVATVTYTLHNACGDTGTTYPIFVESLYPVITGTDSVCVGAVTTLSIVTISGAWSSYTGFGLATVDAASGAVTGLQQGFEIIQFAGTNSCGSFSSTFTVNIHRTAAVIMGPDHICAGTSTSLTDSTNNGAWSTSAPGIFSVAGWGWFVTGDAVSQGTAQVIYSLNNACGFSADTLSITVDQPAAPISGSAIFCVGGSVSLAESTTGGTWSVSPASVATISTSGVVGGVAMGSAVVTYSVSNFCGTTNSYLNMAVNAPAAAITGADTVCPGAVIVLGNTTPGGSWSSSNTGIATVSGSTVGGVVSGAATITYAVTNACGPTTATFNITVLPATSCNIGVADLASANGLRIYPNPASSELYIEYGYAMTARLINMDGRVLRTVQSAGSMELHDLPDGVYVLEVLNTDNQRIATQRIVKTSN